MLKQFLRVTVIGASVLALAACGGGNGAGDLPQNGYRTNATGAGQGVKGSATGYGTHTNRNLQLNQEIARAIERLDGISSARVVLGETNAYVGVELNANAGNGPALGGNNARSSTNASEYGAPGNYYGATDSRAFPMVRGQGANAGNAGGFGRNDVGTGAAAPNMYGLTTRGNGRGLAGGSEISGYSGGDGNPGGFLSGLGRMFGLNGNGNGGNVGNAGNAGNAGTNGSGATNGANGTNGTSAGRTFGLGGDEVGNGLIGGVTMQQSGGGLRANNAGARTGASSTTDLGSGAGSYGATQRLDVGGDMNYGRYQGMNGGAAGGRSGRVGLNRTGVNGGMDDENSRYMYNGGAYGQMSAYQNNNGLSQMVRARVESVVRSLAPNVRNVYVSADRNFVERLGTYGTNGFGGANGRNLIDEFNSWVGGIFNFDDMNRYDMNNDQRNRNGVTQGLNNSFDRNNARHSTGAGTTGTDAGAGVNSGITGSGTGMNRAQAGVVGSAR